MANLPQYTQSISSFTAQTTSVNSSDQEIPSLAKTATFLINITAVSGTLPVLTVQVQAKDIAGNYYNITGAVTANIITTGGTALYLGAGIATTANVSINTPLPSNYRLVYTISGTTPSFTGTVSVLYGF